MSVPGKVNDILVATTENIPGYRIVKTVGIVTGSVVRARHIGKDFMATLRNIVGGEVKEYSELLAQARRDALKRMVEEAKKLGANAVIGVRFASSMIMSGVAEILAYGTAVIVEKEL